MADPSYHHGDLRRALIAAARRGIRRVGIDGVSMRDLAKEVGVSPNAPYRHVVDKGDLLAAVAAEGYRDLIESVIGDGHHPDLATLCRRHAAFAKREPVLLGLMVQADRFGLEAPADLAAARDEWLAALVRVIEAAGGARDPLESLRLAAAIWAVLLGLAQLEGAGALALFDDWMVPRGEELVAALLRPAR